MSKVSRKVFRTVFFGVFDQVAFAGPQIDNAVRSALYSAVCSVASPSKWRVPLGARFASSLELVTVAY